MVLNVAGANHDGAQEFGFLAHTGRHLVVGTRPSTVHPCLPSRRRNGPARHLLSGERTGFEGISMDDLYAVAERRRVPAYRRVTAEVLAAVDD